MDTLEAEKFFKSLGCSHFHMSREYPDKYKEYFTDTALENKWINEEIERLFALLNDQKTPNEQLWLYHSHLLELIEYTKDFIYLNEFYNITLFIKDKVSKSDKVLIAETLIGRRNDRTDGAIRMAIELGLKELCSEYISLCLNLISDNSKRSQEAVTNCNKLKDRFIKE